MIKLLGISVCVLISSLLIKDKHRTFAFLLTLCGIIVMLFGIIGEITQITHRLRDVIEPQSTAHSYLKLMLKALAITLLTQCVSNICRDNGENALAGVCEFGAKAVVAALVLPLFETVIKLVGGIVK